MKTTLLLLLATFSLSLAAQTSSKKGELVTVSFYSIASEVTTAPSEITAAPEQKMQHYAGSISNGMKGDSLFFDVSADGTKLHNLTFKGYWRCSGRLEQTTVGPDGDLTITKGKVRGHITEPPGGGSTAWRFELDATIEKGKASGTFRMNINNLGCDTYKLQWRAVAK